MLGPSQGILGKAALPGAGSAMGGGGAAPGGGEELSQGSGEGAETAGADGAQGGVWEHPIRGKRFSGVTPNSSLPGPARPEAHGQGAGRPAKASPWGGRSGEGVANLQGEDSLPSPIP